MRLFTKKILQNFALFLLIFSGVVMVFMLTKLNETEKTIAESLTVKPVKNMETEMKSFFIPINNELTAAGLRGKEGFYYSLDVPSINKFYMPILTEFEQLSSMGIARTDGYEHDVIPKNGNCLSRTVHYEKDSLKESWALWEYSNKDIKLKKEWKEPLKHDPRIRPWFKGAMKIVNQDKVYWTSPYVYNTTNKLGITASVAWTSEDFDSLTYILAYDLTLEDISKFTENLKATKNSIAFVLSEDEEFIGLPHSKKIKTQEQKLSTLLKKPEDTDLTEIATAKNEWKKNNYPDEPFCIEHEGAYWWFYFKNFQLSDERKIILGVGIPETDLLAQIYQTKYTIMGGFSIVFLLSLVVFVSLKQAQKANTALQAKHKEIEHKNLLIEEKNKDIIDSLNYAKGLQNAILPGENELQKWLKDYFILFKSKEVISGDFYWLNAQKDENGNDLIFCAVADCTGHGVPGALVSVVCANALNRSVKEYQLTDPGKILDKTREIVIETFEKSEKKLRDGMDISLVALRQVNRARAKNENEDKEREHLRSPSVSLSVHWAGANNPLWIIRKTSKDLKEEFPFPVLKSEKDKDIQLIEIKADKQPIGNHDNQKPFTSHSIELKKGDILYSFSDGYADQFGSRKEETSNLINGKKFKSKNLKRLLLSICELNMEEQKSVLEETFKSWKGDIEQVDDICIMGIRL